MGWGDWRAALVRLLSVLVSYASCLPSVCHVCFIDLCRHGIWSRVCIECLWDSQVGHCSGWVFEDGEFHHFARSTL
ncbi:hypothetical protein ARMSODRAFT_291201 [Armillaria solidipes]|uniref:Secreted protein n=1 Tax=Armillaria solidipes TaxID=1076256 RepID=A0A2H3BVJ3_9AGAR|nr:hypothetical protein ARMSODRAFT_291201 [Armillaria solidipes]